MKRINETLKFDSTSINGKYSVLSALENPFHLKIWNYSHHHHSEYVVHDGSMIKVEIPVGYFIVFHYALVQCGSPSQYCKEGEYH